MTYGARLRKATGNGIDRTIYSPVDQMKKVDDTTLDWTKSVETETVRIANQGQITTYPYKMEDTITVGTTHAQNYRLDLENATGAGLNFKVEGDYSDWKDVPSQTTGHNPQQKVNKGSLVYATDEMKAYGHVEIRDSNKDNPSSYRTFGISIRDTDGHETGTWTDPFTVDGMGNITKNVQMDGQEIGKSYTYYFGSVARSDNINQLFHNEYGEDTVFGKMIVTRWQDYVEIEYEIDVAELVRYQNKWGGAQVDSNAIAEVESNYTSICASGEAFSSNYTKQYVEQASASGDRAIVWYNLSNDADDATNIYAAREGDASNNYYLYTKGNITYTGLGHSGSMTDDEIRLFVNTMISSFRSQEAAPYLTVTNEEAIHNGSISTFYAQDRGTDTQDIVAHLLVNDNSVSNQAKTYRLTIRDEKGKVLADHVAVKKDDIYDLTLAASDVLAGQKTYTATLESSYTQEGKPYTTEDTVTIRAMGMPLFDLY